MNYRFASPGGLVGLYELGSEGINWWSSYNDMVRGQGRHSLLDRCLKDNHCPKIAEIMGSTEFWDLHASPDYVGTDRRLISRCRLMCGAITMPAVTIMAAAAALIW